MAAAAVARPFSHSVLVTDMQPAVANLLEESTIQSLRSVQHRDVQGNLITDPDLSNPTRPRLERPLDTIRSFERAIDSGYRRRTSYRAESNDQNGASRRNSYFGNNQSNGYDSRQSPGAGYYGQNTPGGNNRDSYYSNAPSSSRRPHPNGRQPSEYSSHGAPPAPPAHSYRTNSNAGPSGHHAAQPSQDTLATHASGTGSDSTGPWQSGTEPSSDNSSVERMGYYNNNGQGQQQGGYGQGAISEDGAYAYNQYNQYDHQQGGYGGSGGPPPAVPAKSNGSMAPPAPPVSSKLPPAAPRPAPAEKRKSWLSRRFSKSG